MSIVMPSLGAGVGTLVKWHVGPGARVRAGDVVAEVEQDKAVVEITADRDGVIAALRVPEGMADIPSDTVLAEFAGAGAEGEAPAAPREARTAPPVPQSQAGSGSAAKATPAVTTAAEDASRAAKSRSTPPSGEAAAGGVSALAAHIARQTGVDLARVSGSGPGGRVVAADVLGRVEATPAAVAAVPPAATGLIPQPTSDATLVPLTGMRRAIATKVASAKRDVPHFYLTLDCRVDALVALRERLGADRPGDEAPTLTDLIVATTARCLARHPALNASWTGTGIRQHPTVDVAVAVAVDGGLLMPVLRGADAMRIGALSRTLGSLVGRARAGTLAREDYEGGTFTVSNLGMYGVAQFAAIVDPPQAAILAVGAVEPRVVAVDGAPGVERRATLTLSVDHRVADGVAAARFLTDLRALLEDPRRLLL